jgi:selenophosphate synthase
MSQLKIFRKPTLMSLSKTCGLPVKLGPVGPNVLLAGLPKNEDPNLLVGFSPNDDAGIYRLIDEIVLITTADFITLPVNNSYLYGQRAVVNATTDVYAIGAARLHALIWQLFLQRIWTSAYCIRLLLVLSARLVKLGHSWLAWIPMCSWIPNAAFAGSRV